MRLYALIPVGTANLPKRLAALRVAAVTLRHAILAAGPAIHDGIIHVLYNGRTPSYDCSFITTALSGIHRMRFRITHTPIASKIAAVNRGLDEARSSKADLFLSVDDDVVIPPTAISRLTALHRKHTAAGVTCAKAPFLHSRSTAFQRLYSYAVRASFHFNIVPKRPTGSFYCLDPSALQEFPSGCNEGDVLAQMGLPLSTLTIWSEYPRSMSLEIDRQRRLLYASRSIGYERFHDNRSFASSVLQLRQLPATIDPNRFRQSVNLWSFIRERAREF